jgi:hypothetical protein
MPRLALTIVLLLAAAFGQNVQQTVSSETTHYPRLLHAELPLYPPLARSAHISGKVEIEVTVEKGSVVDAQVKSADIQITDPQNRATYDSQAKAAASRYLSDPSLANLKTWQFESGERSTFLVTYIYEIEGKETPLPENPKVELDLPRLVKVTARPFKPTCSDCVSSAEPEPISLCSLQQNVTEGSHDSVRVSGIYGPGLDRTVLEEPSCAGEGTWVELDLQSNQNKEKLRKMLDQSRQAYVVVEGEFYGPPLPDPKLPESIRKSYHPGWGHLAAFRTKLVVHAIQDVKAAPADHADSVSLNHEAGHAQGMSDHQPQ